MTEKLFYKDPYLREARAKIEKIEAVEDGKIRVLLDRTIFYPEGGGQPSDRGIIEGDGFRVLVEKVSGKEEIWHEGKLEGRLPEAREEVRLVLDWEWRYENMKNHTGQHVLSAIIKGLYGAETTGFQIFENYNKIEIDYPGELTWEMIQEIERKTNEVIWGDLPVEVEEYQYLPEDVVKILRKHVSKVHDRIRIIKIGTVDATPCGGTHVKSTREIGFLKILRFYRKSRKLWRIEFVAGNRALRTLNGILSDYWNALDEMPNKNPPLVERIQELKETMDKLEAEKDELKEELWEWKGKYLLEKSEKIGDIRVVTLIEGKPMKEVQGFAVKFVEKNPRTVLLVVGENYVLFARNEDVNVSMRELFERVASQLGGKGGGTDNLARGKVDAEPRVILQTARDVLKELLEG
ncbi:alanyl-tRNA synthetase-related protein (C-terminus) [Thermococcus kodakarensis KOD1]|uniref:Alanyl-tRNA synthetase-related protein (C-terminus) n=1 Tax=Thermococcus kodakarensis (strain ATCC BAA-918 / JCM 12380 / KOD1) TaxID=69014 RepID=Q5JIQ8_THEKO|nr:DHHA1 domain-containing protein [Thermococcus kodakarensis]WCN27544.1 DHHA1 domain-containing protein [Thermococcus kodakarensis]WCN29835.1 DHHA1 domain-containing protein [Thermococcus kodakarensis]BAD85796.1 alanyl-tRNA synthetase-related protein (C-terminus) [Thermococcus kodakarensis KOD1]